MLPCPSQGPRNSLLPSRVCKTMKQLFLHSPLPRKIKHNAIAGFPEMLILIQDVSDEVASYPDAFISSQAYVGVSTSPYSCPYVLFGEWKVWADRGTFDSSFLCQATPPRTGRAFSLLCGSFPYLHCVLILPTLWLFHGQPSKLWFLSCKRPILGILRKPFSFLCYSGFEDYCPSKGF